MPTGATSKKKKVKHQTRGGGRWRPLKTNLDKGVLRVAVRHAVEALELAHGSAGNEEVGQGQGLREVAAEEPTPRTWHPSWLQLHKLFELLHDKPGENMVHSPICFQTKPHVCCVEHDLA